MKTKEEKQNKFVTEFEINGRKYAGEMVNFGEGTMRC